MRSMTGYSKLNYEDENFVINMEIKSVNNKNLSTKIKLPYNLSSLENYIRSEIAMFVSRGSIDFKIEFEDKRESLQELKYDENLAKSCMNILNKMENDFDDKFSNKMDFLIRTFNVISKKDLEVDEEKYKIVINENLKKILNDFVQTKVDEGNRLKIFFKNQLNILKEVLLFSDRVDITEEISRLDSHFKQLEIEFETDKISLGKKIEFIFQEIFREFNTMGVKANMYEISKIVVECKNELEKMREQIMNIE